MEGTKTLMSNEESQIAPESPPPPLAGADSEAPTDAMTDAEDRAIVRSQRTVPYGALAEERARRKELQRELQNAAETRQMLQGRLDLLHELARQQGVVDAGEQPVPEQGYDPPHDDAPGESPIPDLEPQAGAQFRTQLMHSVRDVMRERPDFLAAYQHARQARVSELCALGYAPQEALAITFDNEAEIIGHAYASGQNPAQVIYDYAQRHGYRGGPNGAPVQQRARVAPGSTPAMSEAEKVALAARGQAASKSLSNAGGGSPGTLTLEALAGMSDEEFAEATKGDRWQKLLR